MAVTDEDLDDDDLVDQITIPIGQLQDLTLLGPSTSHFGSCGRARLTVRIGIGCVGNFVPPACVEPAPTTSEPEEGSSSDGFVGSAGFFVAIGVVVLVAVIILCCILVCVCGVCLPCCSCSGFCGSLWEWLNCCAKWIND